MKRGSAAEIMTVRVAKHQLVHRCPCLSCRQDRVREWVGELLDSGIPADHIIMEINECGGKVIIFSGNTDPNCHWSHKQRWCYQFNDKSFDWAMTWWNAHKKVNENV